MFKLPCAGKLGDARGKCRDDIYRFHSGCLSCRWRRKYYSGWVEPPYWIDYTMTWNFEHDLLFNPKTGQKLIHTSWWTANIDPRGHFTSLRCAAIMVFDKILKKTHSSRYRYSLEKPLIEFCMLLTCYPTW